MDITLTEMHTKLGWEDKSGQALGGKFGKPKP